MLRRLRSQRVVIIIIIIIIIQLSHLSCDLTHGALATCGFSTGLID